MIGVQGHFDRPSNPSRGARLSVRANGKPGLISGLLDIAKVWDRIEIC